MSSCFIQSETSELLPQIEASLTGSKILYANIYDPVMDMIQNPGKFGFEETKRGCCGTGFLDTSFTCNAFSPTCGNRSEFLFFDSIHPSEATCNIIGDILDPQIRGRFQA
ncbi:PREDICTED: GDSL esterase/lipase At2g31540-like [Camelina sativa]|uniref:GDSL esterase/lipase At2g31540-like n=1 Tax=Camelina sativa TaxID=90675 RepID=A0ABM0WDZ8_CAMSA|nr:PREDICTED: GDSL esterase/lipase At2g31540-like [Camelina sativa]